uniref:Putative antimicrobial knottin protein Btk-4 n=1 Tax=Bemisia tabaci TaxID=7038 RepID=Q2PQC7_BEMTA|nr:putative antimicrobial knottin protein Btk-4 [Bemisia tabaci]
MHKLFVIFVLAIITISMVFLQADGVCISNWTKCKPDGSIGNCCSGYCFQEKPDWEYGICKNR